MYFFENPVLQHELLSNLRTPRAFLLLFLYLALLSALVYLAWPQQETLDLTQNPEAVQRLVGLFFLGQYLLVSLMTPSFAAGAITGEKERRSYEMLLASPLKPGVIVWGKLIASISHLAILIFCSLPIVMLCLPLGGVSLYEVLAAYLGLMVSVITFGMISLAASSYFRRTAAALVVSYLVIFPVTLAGIFLWKVLATEAALRLLLTVTVFPGVCFALCVLLFANTTRRLLRPPDVGSEGKEVVDLETEAEQAIGLIIQQDQFPDRLFAPAKRSDLLPDHANPVFDKELRSEIFSQGTLMLRVVIQVSMFLAIPLMALCLYIWPAKAPWYISYVLLFNLLVGPVFSAGSVTSERERQTLDLLLTTTISPWMILWGKLLSGLRVSSVLTMFLLWPLFLACLMPVGFFSNLPTVVGYVIIVLLTCVTTAVTALFCSVFVGKTSVSLVMTYLIIGLMFMTPVAAIFFTETFLPPAALSSRGKTFPIGADCPRVRRAGGPAPHWSVKSQGAWSLADFRVPRTATDNGENRYVSRLPAGVVYEAGCTAGNRGTVSPSLVAGLGPVVHQPNQSEFLKSAFQAEVQRIGKPERRTGSAVVWAWRSGFLSPLVATFSLPLDFGIPDETSRPANLGLFISYVLFAFFYNGFLLLLMTWLFRRHWQVTN